MPPLTNHQIITRMQADKIIAAHVDKAIPAVGIDARKQLNNIDDGFTRLTWYASCLTENYRDVCSEQAGEDWRFITSLRELIRPVSVITRLIEPYVKNLANSLSDERIRDVIRIMARISARYTAGSITTVGFVGTVTQAIASSFSLKASTAALLGRNTAIATFLLTLYSYAALASRKANELRLHQPLYYYALRIRNLDMLYFLVEPAMSKMNYIHPSTASNQELAEGLLRLMD